MSLSLQDQLTLKEVQKFNDNLQSERIFDLIGVNFPDYLPIEIQREWAIAVIHRHDWYNVVELVKEWVTGDILNPRAAYAFARLMMCFDSHEEAKVILLAVPDNADIFLFQNALSIVYSALGEKANYEKAFKRAMSLTKEARVKHHLKSRMNILSGRFKDAKAEAEKCLAIDPDDFSAWCIVADSQLVLGNLKAAKDAVIKAFDLYPRNVSSQFKLLLSLGFEDKDDEFLDFLEEKDPELLSYGGNLKNLLQLIQLSGEVELSILLLESISEREPENFYVNLDLGFMYLDDKQYGLAAAQFVETIELQPEHPKPCLGLGFVNLYNEKYKKALTYFEKAQKKLGTAFPISASIDPIDDPQTYFIQLEVQYGTALTLHELGEKDKAIELLTQLLEVFPEHDDAAVALNEFMEP